MAEILENSINSESYIESARSKLFKKIAMGITVFTLLLVFSFGPNDIENIGAWVLVPVIYIIIFIIMTQGRMIEGFAFASLVAFVLGHKTDCFWAFYDSIYTTMMSEDMVWMVVMIIAMGAIIVLLEKSGVSYAFAQWLASKANSKKKALLSTMALGIIVFLDDYLNCILVGSSMKSLTDKYNIPREQLAYIVDSTAAPVTVLIPVSTWFAFSAKVLDGVEGIGAGNGMHYLLQTIPYNFYGWFGLLLVFLIIIEIVPVYGPMKKAMIRVEKTGQLAPPDSKDLTTGAVEIQGAKKINFIITIALLIFFTVYTGIDLAAGALMTLVGMFFLFIFQKIMNIREFFDSCIEGFENMVEVCTLLVLIFVFLDALSQMQFEEWVISAATPYMKSVPTLMPVICFVLFSLTEFATGSTWGMYAIALPIAVPLSIAVGANTVLCISAIISAGALGAHMCMYSDNTILSAASSGCNTFRHAITQLPFCLTVFGLSCIGYVILGQVL